MDRKEQAAQEVRECHARLVAALDQMQATLNAHRHTFGEERAQEIQDNIDRRRFKYELDELVFNAKYPKK